MSNQELERSFRDTNNLFHDAFVSLQNKIGTDNALRIITSPAYTEVLLLKIANNLDEASGENV